MTTRWLARVLLLLLGMATVMVLISQGASATELLSVPFATPVFPCDGILREWFALSPFPSTIHIRMIDMRLFGQKDMIADYGANLFKWSDRYNGNPQIVLSVGWDHYANPTRPRDAWVDFGTHWMSLTAGDALVLQASCVPVGGPWSVQIGGIVYYTTTAP